MFIDRILQVDRICFPTPLAINLRSISQRSTNMPEETKNVFISHIHEDDAGLEKLKDLLKKHGMMIRDSSINSDNPNDANSPEYIKSGILAPQIQWAGTLVVYITPQTKNSVWVNWEIEYALKNGKNVVGVWGNGAKDCDVPEALEDYADAVKVGWHGPSIIDAINGTNNDWEQSDGTIRAPRPIKRYSCG
jgi:hypothetical protein